MSLSINLDIAKRLDITCRRGDTFNLEFVMRDANGDLMDISTPERYSFKMEVRLSDTDNNVAIETDPDSGFIITGTSEGMLTVFADAAVMAGVSSGLYVYDIEATKVSNGNVSTWFFGLFKVNEDVTV